MDTGIVNLQLSEDSNSISEKDAQEIGEDEIEMTRPLLMNRLEHSVQSDESIEKTEPDGEVNQPLLQSQCKSLRAKNQRDFNIEVQDMLVMEDAQQNGGASFSEQPLD